MLLIESFILWHIINRCFWKSPKISVECYPNYWFTSFLSLFLHTTPMTTLWELGLKGFSALTLVKMCLSWSKTHCIYTRWADCRISSRSCLSSSSWSAYFFFIFFSLPLCPLLLLWLCWGRDVSAEVSPYHTDKWWGKKQHFIDCYTCEVLSWKATILFKQGNRVLVNTVSAAFIKNILIFST